MKENIGSWQRGQRKQLTLSSSEFCTAWNDWQGEKRASQRTA
jgi:hypothetical protein